MTRRLLLLCLLACATSAARGQGSPFQPPPDTYIGTSSIAGIVVDDETGRPVRNARVSAIGDSHYGLNTDERGRFLFDRMKEGQYLLQISALPYVWTQYGATRPGVPGTPILLAKDARVENLTVRLVRGGAIEGVITHPGGDPLVYSAVTLWRRGFSPNTGAPTMVAVTGAVTDDRGHYRVFGVPPGEYLLETSGTEAPRSGPSAMPSYPDVRVMRHADVDAARTAAASGASIPTVVAAPLRESPSSTFYPGVARLDQASRIAIAAGQERSGMDFVVMHVPLERLNGTVSRADGGSLSNVAVSLYPAGPTSWMFSEWRGSDRVVNGAFVTRPVPPGDYIVVANAGSGATAATATMAVTVDGRDVASVAMDLQQGVTVSGRVRLADGSLPAPDLASKLRIGLTAVVPDGQVAMGAVPAPIAANGDFTIGGVAPGKYVVTLSSPSSSAIRREWWLSSVMAGAGNLAGLPIEITRASVTLAVTLTNRPSEIAGVVRLASGAQDRDRWVIAFAADPAQWGQGSHRVAAVRPAIDGRFTFVQLPPGEYVVGTAADLEPGQWRTAEFLQQLLATSPARVTVAEGDRKTVTLEVRAP